MTDAPDAAAVSLALPAWLEVLAMGVSGFFGAVLAANRNTPIFGIIVGGLVFGLGGGVIRDVMLNQVPAAIADWYIIPAVAAASLLGGFCSGIFGRSHAAIVALQAVSLGLLVVIGAEKAISFGVSSWAVVALSIITATAGGAMLDALSGVRSALLSQGRLHVTSLAVGAVAFLLLFHFGSVLIAEIGTVVLVITLRVLSHHHGWPCPELPKASNS